MYWWISKAYQWPLQREIFSYQCCQMHDVNPGTLYNWVSRLRKRGYSIPVAETEHRALTENCQEVVKINMISDRPVSTKRSLQVSSANHAILEPPAPTNRKV